MSAATQHRSLYSKPVSLHTCTHTHTCTRTHAHVRTHTNTRKQNKQYCLFCLDGPCANHAQRYPNIDINPQKQPLTVLRVQIIPKDTQIQTSNTKNSLCLPSGNRLGTGFLFVYCFYCLWEPLGTFYCWRESPIFSLLISGKLGKNQGKQAHPQRKLKFSAKLRFCQQ